MRVACCVCWQSACIDSLPVVVALIASRFPSEVDVVGLRLCQVQAVVLAVVVLWCSRKDLSSVPLGDDGSVFQSAANMMCPLEWVESSSVTSVVAVS